MELLVHVAEDILITESIGEVVAFIEREIKKFIEDSSNNVLKITITKNPTRGPPSLGVHVSEVMNIGEALG